ncbi:hypothetical protein CDL15_Pgr008174 [Punica granatum]|uniref:RING-type E3 ubiquitin transferase n=1 Tax=Punica granatum TaxID=22663 RepID=A0A218VUD7_PUNGR|nr:hypothetical protein CDL15_Pgr008174 [Punica granatum]PKI47189.1 hypothetical protein CRG98_032411 [Punica granatum]
MSIHYYELSVRLVGSNALREASPEDAVRFNMFLKRRTYAVVSKRPRNAYQKRKIKGTDDLKSIYVPRSELGSEDALLSAMAPFLDGVPEVWRLEMSEEMTVLARYLKEQLSSPGEPVPPLVKLGLKTSTLVDCREGDDGPDLNYLFERITVLSKADPSKVVSQPATLSSLGELETVPADRIEIDDWCAICTEEYLGRGSSSGMVRMPCSHTYHRGCITRWLRRNHACPICRFRMPHELIYLRH